MSESIFDMMEKEKLSNQLAKLTAGWDGRRVVNFAIGELPMGMTKDLIRTLEQMPAEDRTPREVAMEAKDRAIIKPKLEELVSEGFLGLSAERLVQEMAYEMDTKELYKFVTHLESLGDEICKTWRIKLVSINVGKNPDDEKKGCVFGYFHTDITKEEVEACHKAYVMKNNWEWDTPIPDGYVWKLNRDLEEADDKIAHSAGWVRIIIGDLG